MGNVSHCRQPQIYLYPTFSPESSLCSKLSNCRLIAVHYLRRTQEKCPRASTPPDPPPLPLGCQRQCQCTACRFRSASEFAWHHKLIEATEIWQKTQAVVISPSPPRCPPREHLPNALL